MTDPNTSKRTTRTTDEKRVQLKYLADSIELDRPTAEIVTGYVQAFGRSKRQCFRDLKAVRRRLLMRVLKRAGGRPLSVAMADRRLEELFALAVKAGNLRVALKAAEAQCRLLGLYPDQNTAAQFAAGPVRPDLRKPKPTGTTATPAAAKGP